MAKMYFRSFCLLLVLVILAPGLLAQPEKKIPKPRKAGTKTEQDTSRNQSSERLEIPEVLILGEDSRFRDAESKQVNQGTRAITPLENRVTRQLETLPESSAGDRLPQQSAVPMAHNTQLELRYGSYNSPFVYARHWRQLKRVNFDIEGSFDKSDGQFSNSQFQNWHVNAYGGLQLNADHKMFVSFDYVSKDYGLWASPFDHGREWTKTGIQLGFRGKLRPEIPYEISAFQVEVPREAVVDYLAPDLYIKNIREKNRNVRGRLSRIYGGWQLGLTGDAQFNKYETVLPFQSRVPGGPLGRRFSNALIGFAFEVERRLGPDATASARLTYQYYDLDSLGVSDNRVRPAVDFNWHVSPRVRLSGSYDAFWRITTREGLLSINPAANLSFSHSPIEDIDHALEVGFEWRLDATTLVNLTYGYQRINNLQIWRPDPDEPARPAGPASFLFPVRAVPEAHLSIFKITLTTGTLEPYRIRSRLILSGSAVDEFGEFRPTEPFEKDIPYLEDVRLPIEFEYRLHPKVVAMATSNYLSSRVFEPTEPILGKSFWTLDARITFKTKNFQLYVMGKNLTDRRYQIWKGYTETGLQTFIGTKVQF